MCVIWARWCPVSGSDCLQKRRACVDRAAARCEGIDDRWRAAAADEHRRWPGRSTCVIGSVGECWVANGWLWRAGDVTCRAATTWSGRG